MEWTVLVSMKGVLCPLVAVRPCVRVLTHLTDRLHVVRTPFTFTSNGFESQPSPLQVFTFMQKIANKIFNIIKICVDSIAGYSSFKTKIENKNGTDPLYHTSLFQKNRKEMVNRAVYVSSFCTCIKKTCFAPKTS
jgi:hypothetical protein